MILQNLRMDLDTPEKICFFVFSIIASTLICLTYIPGAYKTWKSNDTRGTSLAMYLLCNLACLSWVIAGAFQTTYLGIEAIGILFSNSFVLVCSSLVVYKKVKFMVAAKKKGMSEYDYVTQIVEATKAKNKK